MQFTIHTLETAPADSKSALVHARQTFGFIPNLEGISAEAPALLKGSMALWDLFETTSFTKIERQIIYLTVNYENSCDYCMAAHSGLAKIIGMSQDNVEALRNGTPLAEYFHLFRFHELQNNLPCNTTNHGQAEPETGGQF